MYVYVGSIATSIVLHIYFYFRLQLFYISVTKVYLNSIKIVQFAPQVIIDTIVTSNGEIMSIFAVKRR
jgi:hypothetical protein